MTEIRPPHYHGHRHRLRTRFIDAMGSGMADYEVLELLLQYAIPRRDVKPIAKALIARFGNIGSILGADIQDLTKVKGVGQNTAILLKVTQKIVSLGLQQDIKDTHVLSTWQKLIEYCTLYMGYADIEQFRVIFLNTRNRIILDELQTKGSIDETAIYPREIVKRCLELKAKSIVLVHNHPSGDATPSQSDILMTEKVKNACATMEIYVHDHIIISKENIVSFKTLGLL